jgi:hypothetical protein
LRNPIVLNDGETSFCLGGESCGGITGRVMGRVEGRPMVETRSVVEERACPAENRRLSTDYCLHTVPTLPRAQIQRPRKVQTASVSSLRRDGTENGGLAC